MAAAGKLDTACVAALAARHESVGDIMRRYAP